MPLTETGAIDIDALRLLHRRKEAGEKPKTATEIQLAEIWKRILSQTTVMRGDNFFELGGDSLLAARLLSRMRDEWGIKLSLRTIFEAATLGDLALAAADAGARAVETLPDTLSETADDAKALLERLDELTNEEVDALLLQMDMGGTARK